MPKMKTKRTFAKRIKVTGSGKLKRHHAYTSHFAANKTHKQKVSLRKSAIMDKTDAKRVKVLLQG
ncbi:MAG: 50S ribosomal protein L35 [Erysipelotrichaceae bacterium]|nr:50S ribosomal protein L35 [Erysipelotrichaceae bacterium]